jgi:F-type H+-transporting ATPase subunit delta
VIAGKHAKRYAQALLELCDEDQSHARIQRDLTKFVGLYNESRDLREVFANPSIDLESKRRVLDELLKRQLANRITRNFLMLLLDRGRMAVLPGIVEELVRRIDQRAGRLRAEVTSAAPLSSIDTSRIQRALEQMTGKKVTVETKVDPTIIGGVVTRIGNIVLDGSVKNQIDKMREHLLHR